MSTTPQGILLGVKKYKVIAFRDFYLVLKMWMSEKRYKVLAF